MKYRLLDILACPECKHFPLKLYVFEREEYDRKLDLKKPYCELYCGFLEKPLKELKEEPPCEQCIRYEIVTGLLYCENCRRWYPIIKRIPRMLPDKLRNKREDLIFLRKYSSKIPEKILYEGKPYNLSSEK